MLCSSCELQCAAFSPVCSACTLLCYYSTLLCYSTSIAIVRIAFITVVLIVIYIAVVAIVSFTVVLFVLLSSSSPKISRMKRKEQQTHLSEETTRLVHPRVISVLSDVEFVVGRQFCMVLAAYPLNMFLRHTKQYICISDLPGHYQQTREEESCKSGPDLLLSPFRVIPRADLLPTARGLRLTMRKHKIQSFGSLSRGLSYS